MSISVELVKPPGVRHPTPLSAWFYTWQEISTDALWELWKQWLTRLGNNDGYVVSVERDHWNFVCVDPGPEGEPEEGRVRPKSKWKAYPLEGAFDFYEFV